ncbi:MAG: hypothetical protein B7Z44_12525 [Caulobacter sp. 12-67-6]|nr:MAG: hypothetical protein B7Z44_12525 [Caulobacter sp. 12-67-6]
MPDRWFGHASAQALRNAVARRAPAPARDHPAVVVSHQSPRLHDAVMLFHIFYADLIDDLAQRLATLRDGMDAIITFPEQWPATAVDALATAVPGAVLVPLPNHGRDVVPFLTALEIARARGHTVFCKAHTKKSPHRSDGAAWRDRLLDGLMSPERAQAALAAFAEDPRLGLLAPENALSELPLQPRHRLPGGHDVLGSHSRVRGAGRPRADFRARTGARRRHPGARLRAHCRLPCGDGRFPGAVEPVGFTYPAHKQ